MNTIVAKFGGSSLADEAHYRKVADIIAKNPARRYIVASAPGKRSSDDVKVTDMLYECFEKANAGGDFGASLEKIRLRYFDIAQKLGIFFSLDEDFDAIYGRLASGEATRDYMASRGEYLNAKLLAEYLGFDFVDAASIIVFRGDGALDAEASNAKIASVLKNTKTAVIPGFYGMSADGAYRTFTRGGSDVTGSIVARGVGAALYENWTDVSGMMMADPRIVDSPKTIDYVSYKELRELSYMGASVLHEDAVFPVRAAGIPINVRNTNCPDAPGTMIVPEVPSDARQAPITGIAGRRGFTTILIEKVMMNAEVGYGRRVLEVLERYDVSFEHLPTGIDTISVVVETQSLNKYRDEVLRDLCREVKPDSVAFEDGMALIAVVGHGMVCSKGMAARIFSAIARAGVNIKLLDQGSSEINIILGVDESDCEKAIRGIYSEFA